MLVLIKKATMKTQFISSKYGMQKLARNYRLSNQISPMLPAQNSVRMEKGLLVLIKKATMINQFIALKSGMQKPGKNCKLSKGILIRLIA